jgi:hypothetical protein
MAFQDRLVLKYSNKCTDSGLNYIDKCVVGTKTIITATCMVDGNVMKIASSDLMRDKFSCDVCRIRKYQDALSKKGCIFVRKFITGGRVYIDYTDYTGEIKTAQSSNVLDGRFLAAGLKTKWQQKTYVYKFSFIDSDGACVYKIGFSVDPPRRLQTLDLDRIVCIDILEECETTYIASKKETELHRKNNKYSLDTSEAEKFTHGFEYIKDENGNRTIPRKHGITEWFKQLGEI